MFQKLIGYISVLYNIDQCTTVTLPTKATPASTINEDTDATSSDAGPGTCMYDDC